MTLHNL